MTLFYLEGPDASGKTTLINELMSDVDLLIHNGVYSSTQEAIMEYDNQLFYYEQLMIDTSGEFNFFLDRGFMAENIYGPVIRNTKIEGPEYMRLLNKIISLQAVLILCVPPLETCLKVWNGRREVEYIRNTSNFVKVWDMYNKLSPPLGMRVYHYDYTKDKDFSKIKEFIGDL